MACLKGSGPTWLAMACHGLLWLSVGCCGKMKKILRYRTRIQDLHVAPEVRIVFSCVRHWNGNETVRTMGL